MDAQKKDNRDRLIALGFVSLLLVVLYGPAAGFFVAADRFLYDRLAGTIGSAPAVDGVILAIEPGGRDDAALAEDFQLVVEGLRRAGASRIVLANPPALAPWASGDWVAPRDGLAPVFVPSRHPLAASAAGSGYFDVRNDSDGIARRAALWCLCRGVRSPALALAVALAEDDGMPAADVARNDATMYLSRYTPLPRLAASDLLTGRIPADRVAARTVFVDADPPLAAAAARLPSGQYVTAAELTAAMLGSLEAGAAITSPGWTGAMEILAPAVLAVLAVLLLPGQPRRHIVIATAVAVAALVAIEAALLVAADLRFDLGRPIIVLLGAALVAAFLVRRARETAEAVDHAAFDRGSDFLSAGRLEPAFAEFRRCPPSDALASAMYKLSLAFEEQAKPERAEAVLSWLKQNGGGGARPEPAGPPSASLDVGNGTPRRLGRYVIEKKLGRGAMGAVYLAQDPRINRAIALKVIPIEKEFEDEELKEARERFFREAESAGRLAHPNIITVYDCGEDQHLAYIAMEYLQGTSLNYFKDPKRLLAPRKALELAARTADALDYAHNQGVIHRDIKPANLLYNAKADVLKISDFGVARLTDNNRTKTGIVLGTPMYMSPEQLSAENLTGQSDLFSLGVTLYELLTGEVPFKATNIALLMKKITSDDPAPVAERRPGVPPSVDTVLSRALAKRPEDRFASGADMATALRNCAKYAST